MCLSAVMDLFASVMIGEMSQAHPEAGEKMPAIFNYMYLLFFIQMGVGMVGLVSGINFLKLKAWSRNALEILAWILFLFTVGFGVYWEYGWITMTSGHVCRGFNMMGALMGLIVIGMFSVALGIMLKYLRGHKVKGAITGTAESISQGEG